MIRDSSSRFAFSSSSIESITRSSMAKMRDM